MRALAEHDVVAVAGQLVVGPPRLERAPRRRPRRRRRPRPAKSAGSTSSSFSSSGPLARASGRLGRPAERDGGAEAARASRRSRTSPTNSAPPGASRSSTPAQHPPQVLRRREVLDDRVDHDVVEVPAGSPSVSSAGWRAARPGRPGRGSAARSARSCVDDGAAKSVPQYASHVRRQLASSRPDADTDLQDPARGAARGCARRWRARHSRISSSGIGLAVVAAVPAGEVLGGHGRADLAVLGVVDLPPLADLRRRRRAARRRRRSARPGTT